MIEFKKVTYTYPGATEPVLRAVSLSIGRGDFVLVAGASGSGKSTLLRCLNGLVPHFSGGVLTGRLRVAGLDPVRASPTQMSRQVGFVFQDPEAQMIFDRSEDEIRFSLENAGLPEEEIRRRSEEIINQLGLQRLCGRKVDTFSGGEKQKLALAAALAAAPSILVLDEPTSQMDPGSAEDFLQILYQLNRQEGLTIILAEHRLERILPYAQAMIYLAANRPGLLFGDPRQVLMQVDLVPPLVSLGKRLDWRPLPLTIEEGRLFLSKMAKNKNYANPQTREVDPATGVKKRVQLKKNGDNETAASSTLIAIKNLTITYGSQPAVQNISFNFCKGQITVIMGPNGAGKTSLLKAIVGLRRPEAGKVFVDGQDISACTIAEICHKIGYLPQDPNAILFADTVLEELETTLKNHGLHRPVEELLNFLQSFGLRTLAQAYPRDLSVGQKQRVALAAMLVTRPSALLLDEPTRGLDYQAKVDLAHLLSGWRDEGMCIGMVTHDVELAGQIADRVVLMEQGRLAVQGPARSILAESPGYQSQIARLFPGTGWLVPEDVSIRDCSVRPEPTAGKGK